MTDPRMSRTRLAALGVALLAALAALPTTMAAQDPPMEVDEARLEEFAERLAEVRERLALTDEQIEEMEPILAAGLEKRLKILEEHGIDISDRSGERERPNLRQLRRLGRALEESREETTQQLAGILSEEQLEEFKKVQEEWAAALRERVRGRNSGG